MRRMRVQIESSLESSAGKSGFVQQRRFPLTLFARSGQRVDEIRRLGAVAKDAQIVQACTRALVDGDINSNGRDRGGLVDQDPAAELPPRWIEISTSADTNTGKNARATKESGHPSTSSR